MKGKWEIAGFHWSDRGGNQLAHGNTWFLFVAAEEMADLLERCRGRLYGAGSLYDEVHALLDRIRVKEEPKRSVKSMLSRNARSNENMLATAIDEVRAELAELQKTGAR